MKDAKNAVVFGLTNQSHMKHITGFVLTWTCAIVWINVVELSATVDFRQFIPDAIPPLANHCFKTITYRLVTPSILFFCIADTTPAVKRSDASGLVILYPPSCSLGNHFSISWLLILCNHALVPNSASLWQYLLFGLFSQVEQDLHRWLISRPKTNVDYFVIKYDICSFHSLNSKFELLYTGSILPSQHNMLS